MKLLSGLLGLGLLAWTAQALEMELVRRPHQPTAEDALWTLDADTTGTHRIKRKRTGITAQVRRLFFFPFHRIRDPAH